MIELKISHLQALLTTAAELGAKTALRCAGLDKPQISKADAYRKYGRKSVDRWITEKHVIPISKGSKSVLLNVKELEAISQTQIVFNKHLID